MKHKIYDLRSIVYNGGWHSCSYINEERCIYSIYYNEKVGSYRGEDSGAIYPILEKRILEMYNIAPLLDEFIDEEPKIYIGRGLIRKRLRDIVHPAPGCVNLHSDVLWRIYDFLSKRDDLDKYLI